MERALLVTVDFLDSRDGWFPEEASMELAELARTSGAEVVDEVIVKRIRPTPNLFIGKGKVQELARVCHDKKIQVVILNNDISGTQQRNLEEILGVKTIDRTQLILDIFARHARSLEGNIQVELAQLEYLFPRLTGRGIMLSRLGGGIGTRGPGEKKLELDRRRIRKRIFKLKKDLENLRQHRQSLRKRRREHLLPTVAIVGYTNAGKSTLMNALTGANQVVKNSLFSTLDPLRRTLTFSNNRKVIFLDTVGFLHNLPHHLIEAFKATLEEVSEADILLHVLDVTHPKARQHNEAVLEVLNQIGARDKPTIIALNKIDKCPDDSIIERSRRNYPGAVPISALKRQNLDSLIERIASCLLEATEIVELFLPQEKMNLLSLIYREGRILKTDYRDTGVYIEARLPFVIYKKLKAELTGPALLKGGV
jgi:GTP-binding protein HflX